MDIGPPTFCSEAASHENRPIKVSLSGRVFYEIYKIIILYYNLLIIILCFFVSDEDTVNILFK